MVTTTRALSVSEELAYRLVEEGGFTVTLAGDPVSEGYAVSVYKDREYTFPLPYTIDDISSQVTGFTTKNLDLLALDPRLHLGGWVEEGTAFLDLSIVVRSFEDAVAVGQEHGQRAVFCLHTGETLYLDAAA